MKEFGAVQSGASVTRGSNYSGGESRVAKSHIDGICLDCSVWLDGRQILKDGVFIDPKLEELAKKLGK